ncbi:MAG: ABC transporter substrate-binding protein [Ignavibacteria bacterium]|nr:ABC transporter substrate-binding protein [Ignavibacteria bacterium]
MNRKSQVLCLLLGLLSLVFLSCEGGKDGRLREKTESTGPVRGGTLNVALWVSFPTLDWQSTVGHPLPQVMLQVYEGLFGLGKDFDPEPELTESWAVSKDKMTWTFGLRKGVLFHNGKEMTAEDVKASLERWKRVSPRGVTLKELREIEIVSKDTVRFYFDKPVGRFLKLILAADESKAVIMPKEIAEASPQGGALNEIVGTGPYQFDEYRTEEYLRLKRFEKYVPRTDPPNYQTGKKVAYLDDIIFWIVPEAFTRVAGLEREEYDVVTRLPDSEFERLRSAEGVEPLVTVPALLDYLIFNHKKGDFADINMRRAVQSLVNVEEVDRSMVASKEFWTLNPSIYPPESAYNTDEASEYYNQGNIEKGKEFLKKAGYRGEKVKFLVLREEPEIYRASITVAEQMKAAGIKVDLMFYDLATWVAKRADPYEMDMFITKGYWLDPSLFHAEFGGRFPGWFTSPETEEVFTELASETDFEKRYQLGKKLQRLFYEKVAFVNVGYHYGLKAKRTSVKDPEGNISRGNLTLHNVWLDR